MVWCPFRSPITLYAGDELKQRNLVGLEKLLNFVPCAHWYIRPVFPRLHVFPILIVLFEVELTTFLATYQRPFKVKFCNKPLYGLERLVQRMGCQRLQFPESTLGWARQSTTGSQGSSLLGCFPAIIAQF